MRTIKFRGKRIDNGKWAYGDLHTHDCTEIIVHNGYRAESYYPVATETIGQFTDLCDIHGIEIYEGDIITHLQHRIDGVGVIYEGYVEWRQEEGCYVFVDRKRTKDGREAVRRLIGCNDIRIIGNIYDNPEFMEGGEK